MNLEKLKYWTAYPSKRFLSISDFKDANSVITGSNNGELLTVSFFNYKKLIRVFQTTIRHWNGLMFCWQHIRCTNPIIFSCLSLFSKWICFLKYSSKKRHHLEWLSKVICCVTLFSYCRAATEAFGSVHGNSWLNFFIRRSHVLHSWILGYLIVQFMTLGYP